LANSVIDERNFISSGALNISAAVFSWMAGGAGVECIGVVEECHVSIYLCSFLLP